MTSDGPLDDEDVHYCILHMDILVVMLSTWLACTFEKTRVATCCKWKGRDVQVFGNQNFPEGTTSTSNASPGRCF